MGGGQKITSQEGRRWKGREVFSKLSVPTDKPVMVRIDGWKFHSLTKKLGLSWPYDVRLARAMVSAAEGTLKRGLPIVLAYTFSDEISYLLRPPIPFSGRVEKMVSVISSLSSSFLSLALREETGRSVSVAADGRVVLLEWREVRDYLTWRQSEAWRNCLNAYAQLALLRKGLSGKEVAQKLLGVKSSGLHDLIWKELGVNPAQTPSWQRRGVLVYWTRESRETINPLSGREMTVTRRKVRAEWEVPLFSSDEGGGLLDSILGGSRAE